MSRLLVEYLPCECRYTVYDSQGALVIATTSHTLALYYWQLASRYHTVARCRAVEIYLARLRSLRGPAARSTKTR